MNAKIFTTMLVSIVVGAAIICINAQNTTSSANDAARFSAVTPPGPPARFVPQMTDILVTVETQRECLLERRIVTSNTSVRVIWHQNGALNTNLLRMSTITNSVTTNSP